MPDDVRDHIDGWPELRDAVDCRDQLASSFADRGYALAEPGQVAALVDCLRHMHDGDPGPIAASLTFIVPRLA